MDFTINGKIGPDFQGSLIKWDQRSNWDRFAAQIRVLTPYLASLTLAATIAGRKQLPTWAAAAFLGASTLSLLRVVVDHAILPSGLVMMLPCVPNLFSYFLILFNRITGYTSTPFTLEVDGFTVKAHVLRPPNPSNRYILRAVGNGESMDMVGASLAGHVGYQLQANVVIFDYPGVGGLSGFPHRRAMMHTYQALLKFLETKETSNGLGAKEIILWGDSIGGGCSGDALKGWEFKEGIKYVVVKRKTFSTMTETVDNLIFKGAGTIIELLGWNFDSVTTSKELEEKGIHEIIIQETKFKAELNDAENVINDGPISKTAALAYALLKERTDWVHKTFIDDDSGHMEHNLQTPGRVKAAIEMVFS
jgi:hypothetical protein